MYEGFTDHARQVMKYARQESQRLRHEYVGTEHLLFALIKEGTGVGVNVLRNMEIDPQLVVTELEKIVVSGPTKISRFQKLVETPRLKRAIEFGENAARDLGHRYFGTEHILLGLLQEKDGVGGLVLAQLGVELETTRQRIRQLLAQKTKWDWTEE